ncbi:MAG: DUF4251 domain-containing protein [Bacteroidales bacterium]|nr:DUF4251 domain-containing protein [Bacteroidales bacterium]
MKKMGILTLCALIAAGGALYAQEKKSKKERRLEVAEKVQGMVHAQEYKFVAQQALPMSGRSINLTADYDMSVAKDSVIAYLPFFGRAYVAPVNPLEGGIKFQSVDFDYKLQNAKKGGWTAHIVVRNAQQRIELTLHITTTGLASLSVLDHTRQTISFSGYLEERTKQDAAPTPKQSLAQFE